MSVENRFKMSAERLEELKEELNYLQTVRQQEVADQIREARSFGDLSEN
ncbi:MAG: transcription elongation factor GreA, partial [Oscillospiraceae bacterium]|nr:transcription elongation factor GreA [Oscillospiraceae bacterium]